MPRLSDPAQAIQVTRNQVFCLELAGSPTSGYLWEAQVDERHLELLEQEYVPGGGAVGGGGWEILRFRAKEPGETEILMEYRRPWEQEARDTQRFQIRIV